MSDTFWVLALVANTIAIIFLAGLCSKCWAPKPAYYYNP